MKPYSLDLRQRIIDAYSNEEGTVLEIAQRFKVSTSSVRRLIKRYLSTGSIAPKPYTGGNKPKLQAEHLEILANLISEDNDATNFELAERIYEKTELQVSIWTIGRGLKKLNITKKAHRPLGGFLRVRTEQAKR
ncbi:MAG: transposase [Prochloraceae cyanobacterium]|nr:transposase [Prochloraceae cyanobacterium]